MGINFWAIITASFLGIAIDYAWYPLIAGRRIKSGNQIKAMIFITFLVMAFVLRYFVIALGSYSFASGAKVGILIWIGFVLVEMFRQKLLGKKLEKEQILENTRYLLVLFLMGGILGEWQ